MQVCCQHGSLGLFIVTGGQVLVGVGELVGCGVDDAGLAPDAAAGTNLAGFQLANRQRQQIRWDGDSLRSDASMVEPIIDEPQASGTCSI